MRAAVDLQRLSESSLEARFRMMLLDIDSINGPRQCVDGFPKEKFAVSPLTHACDEVAYPRTPSCSAQGARSRVQRIYCGQAPRIGRDNKTWALPSTV